MEDIKLQQVEAFRTIYALCEVMKSKDEEGRFRLKATHYACVLEYGRNPIWGIFSARTNKLIQLLGSREQVENQYPTKRWYRRQATWSLGKIQEALDIEHKREILRSQLSSKKHSNSSEAESNVVELSKIIA